MPIAMKASQSERCSKEKVSAATAKSIAPSGTVMRALKWRTSRGTKRLAVKVPTDSGTNSKPEVKIDAPNPYPTDRETCTYSTTTGMKRYMAIEMRNPEASDVITARWVDWRRLTRGSWRRNS